MSAKILFKQNSDVCGSEFSLSADAALIVMEDGSGRFLQMNDRFYSVPPVGLEIVQLTLNGANADAANWIADKYGIDPASARADVDRFIHDLSAKGILCRRKQRNERPHRLPITAQLSASCLKASLRCCPAGRIRVNAILTLARLSLRFCGWTATVQAWTRALAQVQVGPLQNAADAQLRTIDEEVREAGAKHLLGVDCKERALSCWALAKSAGLAASLVIGVELYPLSGHCWCEVGSRILSDTPQNCGRYLPVLRYGSN